MTSIRPHTERQTGGSQHFRLENSLMGHNERMLELQGSVLASLKKNKRNILASQSSWWYFLYGFMPLVKGKRTTQLSPALSCFSPELLWRHRVYTSAPCWTPAGWSQAFLSQGWHSGERVCGGWGEVSGSENLSRARFLAIGRAVASHLALGWDQYL